MRITALRRKGHNDSQKKSVEPVAIIGMAFRFPGDLSDEQGLWEALKDGQDSVGRLGCERWAVDELQHPKRSEPGRSITFSAGVLSRIEEFDADFFGISPREAEWLDPQQRLLLELAWEAMENSGQAASRLAATNVAVYVGISGIDYGLRKLDDLSSLTAHLMTGNTLSLAANRLSYVFDLRGPSVAMDTACSSSLLALHHACNSLRSGESSAALVGGVNLLLHPYPFIGFTKAAMLSATGRCRTFDASADGYVRAEGGAVLLLKPLGRAVADGDNIQAVILATGANADGRRKTGITIPSCEGQAELMQTVLQFSGISPSEVDYIEAHGTGTMVGDPIEAAAIGKVYGRCRPRSRPLPIGSIKTNLGHLEAASGMAGLVKAVLVLKNRVLPPSIHLVTPNPNIDFSGLNLEVVTDCRPLTKSKSRPLVAGVNSFGFGGANGHVLLQEYRPKQKLRRRSKLPAPPLFLSARTAQALREAARRYAKLLKQKSDATFYDVAYAAAFRRQRFETRLALRAANAEEAADRLTRFAQGQTVAQVVLEEKLAQSSRVAFIYSGNGAQWVGMGRRLMVESPRFADLVTALDAPIHTLAGFSICQELHADESTSRLDDTGIAQPLLFAIQVALTTMLREQGIEAAAVAGHSLGEVAAAWAAGGLELDQAIAVICARSAAQALTRGAGRIAAVGLAEAAMREVLVAERCRDVEIAGINSPNNITLSGSVQDLERLCQILEPRGVFFRLLDLDYAFHSRHMDPIKDRLADSLANLTPRPFGAITFVSTVTGDVLQGTVLDASYWWRNVRQPVHFAQAISTLINKGCRIFIEIGPHAILQRYVNECLSAMDVTGRVLPTLRRDDDGLSRVEETALRVHLLCDSTRLGALFPAPPSRHVLLPNYPWQRTRHWHSKTSESYALIERRRVHPLLGWRLKEADATWENAIDLETHPWLIDHKVGGAIVLPGSAYVELALAAAREWFGGECFELEDLDILVPVVFDGEHARSLRFELTPRDGSFQIRSRQRLSKDEWTLNALGRLPGAPAVTGPENPAPDEIGEEPIIEQETHYRLAAALQLEYGPAFQGLESACVRGQTLCATLALPEVVKGAESDYVLHPAMLDVCFQSLVDFFQADIEAGQGVPFLPVRVGRLSYHHKTPVTRFRTHLLRRSTRSVAADFELLDASGCIVATLSECRFRATSLHRKDAVVPPCWKIEPRLTPHPTEQQHAPLPSSSELVKQVRAWFVDEEERLARAAYFRGALPLFEALTVSFAHAAFYELFSCRGEWLHRTLAEPMPPKGEQRPFFRWLVRRLRQQGLLVEEAGTWRLEATTIPPAADIWRTIVREYPACLPDLVLAGCVGLHLPALLAGAPDPQARPLSLGPSHVPNTLGDESPAYLGTRLAAEQILHNLAVSWPTNRRLRVLEIAGGASELARQLANAFPEDRIDYVLAVSEEETRLGLQDEYTGHPFVIIAGVEHENLELSADAHLPELFDVVLVRRWLHRRRNPLGALSAVRRKLAFGGLLILAEQHPDLSADFMNGHDPLWWREMESAEPVSCLLTPRAWELALAENGFEDVETFFEPASEDLAAGSYLVLAKRTREDTLPVPEPAAATWLLLCDAHSPSRRLGDHLCRRLESQGQRVAVAIAGDERSGDDSSTYDPQNPESVRHVLEAVRRTLGRIDHVVYLGLSSEDPEAMAEAGDWLERTGCTGLLHLVQALEKSAAGPPRFWLVISGGALASGTSGSWKAGPLQASLWSFGRVIMNEYPALACTLIDAASDPDNPEMVRRLEQEFLMPDGEREIVLTPQTRHSLRMGRVDPLARPSASGTMPRFRLDFREPGQLRNLVWVPQPKRPLADDEVEVRPVAAGLNFRDVMYTMGLLPDEAVENGFTGASLGLECAGIVTHVGARVHQFSVGDAVMGFGSGCLASHVVTKVNALTPKPAAWSFEAAATVPTVFLTVYYALKHLADLQPGERVLIHGAAGGVGIAAVQLARHLGAEVFATAGSKEKRDFVHLLGADHVLDSRSLAFANHILDQTQGEGVDVVLNSLAGEAIRRNLRVLKPFGRFLELGKRDFFENTSIGLRPFKNNISYFGIDVDQLLIARPALTVKLFRDVMALFRDGELFPLPYRAVSAERVIEAFRTLQQGRHIGKVVVTLDDARIQVDAPHPVVPPVGFKEDATYLVTGGLSGFGLESARWLAEHGVGHLVLLGRLGGQTPRVTAAVQELETYGTSVEVVACDVSDRVSLQSVLTKIQRERPPLRGILHAAMVIDDALITNLDVERFRRVLAPKLLGAWHLHNLTRDIPLDHFILYSSFSTFIGNPGQANYVAANAYLEGLATLRRSLGLPVTCISWGPIGDIGYLARNEAVKDRLTALLGAAPLTAKSALAMLEPLLARDVGTLAIADFNWHVLARRLHSVEGPLFERLRREAGQAASADEQGENFHALLLGKSPEDVRAIVQTLVTKEVAQILGIGTDRIDPARSLLELGIDSLMGAELALALEKRFDIRLPVMMLNEGPTIERVSARLVEKILKTQGPGDVDEGGRLDTLVESLAAKHGETFSRQEVAHTVAETQLCARTGTRRIP